MANFYIDTRGKVENAFTFSEAVVKGIAPGGGLFVPQKLPHLTLEQILNLNAVSYAQRAAFIYNAFGVDIEAGKVDALMHQAYGTNFDVQEIAPVRKVGDMHVLELWHGPTSAFKDMALQCLPLFFSESIKMQRASGGAKQDYLIAVATSGDTGKAALQGFANAEHISIVVFYPDGGVSDIQYKQMATQVGNNLYVYAARGNFDDCQTSVKRMFGDAQFSAKLAAEKNIILSSANSINWGRLMPQIAYYISAYGQMVAQGTVKAGECIDVCVPTGNFGNILAAWYAKQMGTPIENIICASNTNKVLFDFIETGTYTIKERDFVLTPSPSMDILVSSNLERQLFELTGRDAGKISQWMDDLNKKQCFSVDEETLAALKSDYTAGWVGSDDCLKTIKSVFEENKYLIDPHTAVAWNVAARKKGKNQMLVVSTAHWAKFGTNVYRALHNISASEPLPQEAESLTGAQLNRKLAQEAGVEGAPKNLDALDDAPILFDKKIDGNTQAVEQAVLDYLS